jgi:hypothetical protein
MNPSEIREAMDSYRPGSDDLNLPEMAPLAEALSADAALRGVFGRSQRLDRRIAATMRDVPVPAGLVERLLARLPAPAAIDRAELPQQETSSVAMPAIATALDNANTIAAADDPHAASPTAPPVAPRRFSRRAWSAAAVAACGLVAAAFAAFWRPHTPLSAANLVEECGDWSAQIWQQARWNPLPSAASGLTKYPLSPAIRVRALAWTDVSSIVGEDAVAYDISIGGHRAALFVIPSGDSVADPVPPVQPQSSTGGQMIGCWQAGGMVYVLVVEGDARAYQNLVRPSAQPPFA